MATSQQILIKRLTDLIEHKKYAWNTMTTIATTATAQNESVTQDDNVTKLKLKRIKGEL